MMLQYARMLSEMSLEGRFPEYVEFVNNNDVVIMQRVKFEWIPFARIESRGYH